LTRPAILPSSAAKQTAVAAALYMHGFTEWSRAASPVLPEPVGADTTMLTSEWKAALKVALCTGLKYLHMPRRRAY